MSMGGVNSVGTQVNRMLDALGMPDAYGDKIGAMIDLSRGDLAGFQRNITDLASGFTTRQMDLLQGMGGSLGMSRGFIPRLHFSGPHLARWSATYVTNERVGRHAHVGQKYDTGRRFLGIRIKGRISGRMYRGSFRRPIRLGRSGYLYRGRMYKNMGAIMKDMRDGRVDGLATRRFRVGGWIRTPFMRRMPIMLRAHFNPAFNVAQALGKLFGAGGGLLGGIPQGMGGAGGAGGAQGAAPSSESVLSNPNLSLEDKLMMLMAKLSEHMDKQIEDKMKQIEGAMKQQGAKKKGGGGLFGSLFKAVGGALGTAFGGPLGGIIGGKLGGVLGGASGGAGGAGKGGKKPNLQLLQSQLQSLMQKRQQMFQTMQNIMKSLHDTSMAAIRNLKA